MRVAALSTTRSQLAPAGHGARGALSRCGAALFVVAVSSLTAFTACGLAPAPVAARPLDEVKASNVLRVALYEKNRPFSWRDEGDKLVGIDIELATELAKDLGVGLELIARMQGEDVDTDLRANVWKGPVAGGPVGDVMLHVPHDRDLGLRNREAVLVNPYFEQRIALAFDPARLGEAPKLDAFKTDKVGVQLGSVSDYFIMFADGGAYRQNVLHFVRMDDGAKRFKAGEMPALLAIRSEAEGWLAAVGGSARFAELPMPGIQRARWNIGMAVKENSRDLGYALAAALDKLKASGALAAICARHGVTYAAPPLD